MSNAVILVHFRLLMRVDNIEAGGNTTNSIPNFAVVTAFGVPYATEAGVHSIKGKPVTTVFHFINEPGSVDLPFRVKLHLVS